MSNTGFECKGVLASAAGSKFEVRIAVSTKLTPITPGHGLSQAELDGVEIAIAKDIAEYINGFVAELKGEE